MFQVNGLDELEFVLEDLKLLGDMREKWKLQYYFQAKIAKSRKKDFD